MRADKIGVATATFLAFLIVAALPLSAGPLNGHPNAFGPWSGTTPYSDGGSLTGTVDWAVFDAAGFAASGLTGLGGWDRTGPIDPRRKSRIPLYIQCLQRILPPHKTLAAGRFAPLGKAGPSHARKKFGPIGRILWTLRKISLSC